MRAAPQGTNKGGGFCLLTANDLMCESKVPSKGAPWRFHVFGAFITLGRTHEYKSGSLTSYASCPIR